MLENFHFLRPAWLLALVPCAALVWLLLRLRDPRSAWRGIIAPHLLDALLEQSDRGRRWLPVHLLALAWLATILALAGPAWIPEPSPFAEERAGLIAVIEVTPSMESEDVAPTRLERGVQKLHDLLAARPDTHVALIAYAGSAHLAMPLTRDRQVIDYFARALQPELMPAEGEHALLALEMARSELDRARRAGSILLVSDGLDEASLAALDDFDGPPVHVLAVTGALETPGLDAIADATGGSVTRVSADDEDVERLADLVESQVQTVADADSSPHWRDAGYLLTPGIALLVLAWSRKGWAVDHAGGGA